MACTPTPTQTVFTTVTSTTSSVSGYITSEVDTLTSTSLILSTICNVENATALGASGTCLSSTVVTSTSFIDITTTVPITAFTTVPSIVVQTIPVQTLFSPCPSDPPATTSTTTSTPNQDTSSTTRSKTTVTETIFTYSDSNGVHVSASVSTMSSDGQLNAGGNGNKSTSKLAPIIGGVVGGVLVILGIIALVWYILWRRDQNAFLFDDDDDAAGGLRPKSVVSRRGRRSLNLDEEVKGSDSNAYQYGMVGGSPSPSASPIPHSQYSSIGGYSHRRSGSRDALMATGGPSIPGSPTHLDVPLPGARRISQNSSGRGESIMMMSQPVTNREDPLWGHHPRPSSSLLEAPITYPPGHSGFYQQYGPLETATSPTMTTSPTFPPSGGIHKPPLEPTLLPATQPLPAHQGLLAAAGLSDPTPSTSRPQIIASPPPGAAGARPYVERQETSGGGDMYSAVMAGADRAAMTPTPTSTRAGSDVGFGRQRRAEKAVRVETPRSPVVQHEDGGRVTDPQQATGAEAPPPAYTPQSP